MVFAFSDDLVAVREDHSRTLLGEHARVIIAVCEFCGGQGVLNRRRTLQRHMNLHEPTLAQGACMRHTQLTQRILPW